MRVATYHLTHISMLRTMEPTGQMNSVGRNGQRARIRRTNISKIFAKQPPGLFEYTCQRLERRKTGGLERGISKALTEYWNWMTVFAFLSRAICIKDSAGKWRPFMVGIYVGDEAARPIRDIQVSHKARKIVSQESRVPTGRKNQDGLCRSKNRHFRRKSGATRSKCAVLEG
jgi:hypothetical protein